MRDVHNTLLHKWLDVKGANSIWTCCCWQQPPPTLHSRADSINGSHWQNCVRRMSERSYIIWKYGDVSKSSSDTRRLAQMNKNILEWVTAYNGKSNQWCHWATFTAATELLILQRTTGCIFFASFTFSPGGPGPQNREYLWVWAALNAEGAQRIGVVPDSEPERALRWAELTYVMTNGPSSIWTSGGSPVICRYSECCSDCEDLRPLRCSCAE